MFLDGWLWTEAEARFWETTAVLPGPSFEDVIL